MAGTRKPAPGELLAALRRLGAAVDAEQVSKKAAAAELVGIYAACGSRITSLGAEQLLKNRHSDGASFGPSLPMRPEETA